MSAPFPSGKLPTTRVRRLISRLSRSIMLFYSSRLSFSYGGVGKPPFSRAGRAGGLTCGATMARLGPRYGSGRFSLRATSSRVEGDGLAGTGAAPMVSFPVCAPRSFFSFWFATIPASVSQAHRSEYRSAQREGPPGPPPTNATRTHTGAMKVHSNRQSTPSYIDKKPRNVRRSDGSEGETGRPCRRHPSPGYSPANGTGTAMTAKEKT